jgi:uncharacterized protein YbbK (DUF523 family)
MNVNAKILVSACLVGRPIRYDGSAKNLAHDAIVEWQAQGRVVAVCPELAAGFGVPRPPAEIAAGGSGEHVLLRQARVLDIGGTDLTEAYIAGAEAALALAHAHNCRFALLVDGSPSCGSRFIYDGAFANRKHAGIGVTTALLRSNGIAVFSEGDVDALQRLVG